MSEQRSIRKFQVPLITNRRTTFEMRGVVLGASLPPLSPLIEDVGADGTKWVPGLDIWFEHDEADDIEQRTFEIFTTGQFLPDTAMYVTTVIDGSGTIHHLYQHASG